MDETLSFSATDIDEAKLHRAFGYTMVDLMSVEVASAPRQMYVNTLYHIPIFPGKFIDFSFHTPHRPLERPLHLTSH